MYGVFEGKEQKGMGWKGSAKQSNIKFKRKREEWQGVKCMFECVGDAHRICYLFFVSSQQDDTNMISMI